MMRLEYSSKNNFLTEFTVLIYYVTTAKMCKIVDSNDSQLIINTMITRKLVYIRTSRVFETTGCL